MKVLRTDNGLEFVSDQFNTLCTHHGIKRHKTVAGTPKQNGLAERMNRTILERVRCMLLGAGLPKVLWGEATNTGAYLINKSPSSALEYKTPMEVWSGSPTNYSNLRVFGTLAYAHVKKDKLDARAKKCLFLGYAEGVKGYMLWRLGPNSFKLIINRDVTFDETRMGMYSENSECGKEKTHIEVKPFTDKVQENTPINPITDPDNIADEIGHSISNLRRSDHAINDYQLVRGRERRIPKPNRKLTQVDLICYALTIAEEIEGSVEPRNFKESHESEERQLWLHAMEEELEALRKNNTWRLVELPKGQKVVGCKWIFKKKSEILGVQKTRYKARLVAKGFTQVEGVDYNEIFALLVKHYSVRILMSIANQF